MKRLLIALGALTLVSSAAVAAEDFRPTGSVKQEIRWYGDKEEVDTEGVRLTLAEGGIRFTEKFYIDYRVRDYINYQSGEDFSDSKNIRTRLYYDHGYLGDTKIDMRQRFEIYGNGGTSNYNQFTYTPEFRFKDYFTAGDNFSVDTFTLRPSFRYKDDNKANNTYKHVGADFLSVYSFPSVPGDLAVEFNVYTRFVDSEYNYKNDKGTTIAKGESFDGTKDENFIVDVEFYAYYGYDLGTWNGIDFTAYYEFGMDPATFYDRKVDTTSTDADGNTTITGDKDVDWTFYNDFELQASYKVNASTSIYGAVAAEYANLEGENDAANWKWMPYAYVGWRTKF